LICTIEAWVSVGQRLFSQKGNKKYGKDIYYVLEKCFENKRKIAVGADRETVVDAAPVFWGDEK